jgi:hypothetical protein
LEALKASKVLAKLILIATSTWISLVGSWAVLGEGSVTRSVALRGGLEVRPAWVLARRLAESDKGCSSA